MKYAINMKQYRESECISIEFSIPKSSRQIWEWDSRRFQAK